MAARKRYPHHRVERRENDDEHGIQRLEPGRRNHEVAKFANGIAVGEQVQRGAGLFETGPEQRRREEQDDDNNDATAFLTCELAEQKNIAEVDERKRDNDVGAALRKR